MLASTIKNEVQDNICITGIKIYEKFGSKPTRSQRKQQEKFDAKLSEYLAGSENLHLVSNKEPIYRDPKLTEYINNMDISTVDKMRMNVRGGDGFLIACHVFAYLSGKEGKHSDKWLREHKECANMISRKLVGMDIYPGFDTDLGPSDYFVDCSDMSRPILTKSIINEARKRFPLELDKEKFNDDDVDVMDVEEQIKKAEEKKNASKTDKPDEKKEVIIDVDPKDIREVKTDSGEDEDDEANEKTHKSDVVGESPIFDYTKMNLAEEVETKEVTATQARLIGEYFGKYLNGRGYQLNRIQSGAIEMILNNPDGSRSQYWIDPNLCVGNGYNIIARIPMPNKSEGYDTIMVHQSEDEILQKVFNNRDYMLTPEEVQRCLSHMFVNQNIYFWIDMSNMDKRLEKMTSEEFDKLGKKFTFIINALNGNERGRMRVYSWKNINNFELRSDSKAKTPFPGLGSDFRSGVIVKVQDDTVTITHTDNSSDTLTIENYGAL